MKNYELRAWQIAAIIYSYLHIKIAILDAIIDDVKSPDDLIRTVRLILMHWMYHHSDDPKHFAHFSDSQISLRFNEITFWYEI